MVFYDVNAGSNVKFYNFKVCTKKPNSVLYIGKISHYYDVFLISVVDFIDKQLNDNGMINFSIKIFGNDDNNVQLFKELTVIVPHD